MHAQAVLTEQPMENLSKLFEDDGSANYAAISDSVKERLAAKGGTAACSSTTGVQHTYLCALDVIDRGVIGDFVECGVAAGAQIGSMSEACAQRETRRTLHMFDSFQGTPLAGPRDYFQPGVNGFLGDHLLPIEQRLVSSGQSAVPIKDVQMFLVRWGYAAADPFRGLVADYVFHPGWFQDTVRRADDVDKIALLRLDCNLHESYMECLTWLYHKVQSGAWVIIDDYGDGGGAPAEAVHEYLASVGDARKIKVYTDYGVGAFIK